VAAILTACREGKIKTLLLQGPELLRLAEAREALLGVPFVAVMATHEEPELDRAQAVLPAALWAEVEGTVTNYQRRVQRLRRTVPPPGEAAPRWELCAEILRSLGQPLRAASAREVFALVTESVKDYSGLDYKALGHFGHVLPLAGEAAPAAQAGA
jgi:predicted molibdopterin-dependent oxidoreductase YjgC